MLSFEVRKTGGESEIRKVHRDVIHIGASTGNDLVVRARGVLGRHARISVAGEELRLEVLGTSPGTDVTLNGSIVKTAALAAGDRISIGEATITLLNGPAPNPNRISAPPPRGRDAFSLAQAALAPAPQAAAPVLTAAAPGRQSAPARGAPPVPCARRSPRRGARRRGSLGRLLRGPPQARPVRGGPPGPRDVCRLRDAAPQPRVHLAAARERGRGDRRGLEGHAPEALAPDARGGPRPLGTHGRRRRRRPPEGLPGPAPGCGPGRAPRPPGRDALGPGALRLRLPRRGRGRIRARRA